ncbi:MAG: hypothetical protein HXY28_05710 [Hydrogenophilaceae bacterium]|jgi:hypothetical protein|nr:hypothetical protein [Hydrogenophilaceae bacterium]
MQGFAEADAVRSEDLRMKQRRFQNGDVEIAADLAGPSSPSLQQLGE